MKLKKAIELLAKEKRINLYTAPDEGATVRQWVGSGGVLYAMEGLPQMSPDMLRAAYDIGAGVEIVDCGVLPEGLICADVYASDNAIEPESIQLDPAGIGTLCFATQRGEIFFQQKYLKPAEDARMLGYFERVMPGGALMLAVKDGARLLALVAPIKCLRSDWMNELETLIMRLRRTMDEQEED